MSSIRTGLGNAINRLMQHAVIRNVAFEVTQDCNQDCAFCYNVWKCGSYPRGALDTPRTLDLLDRIIRGYRPRLITFTGGEPLLRPDLAQLIRHLPKRIGCTLISNGTLMNDAIAAELADAGVTTFEFTLLAADRETHNSLVRRESFDQLIEAIASVRAVGGAVATTFVATSANIGQWEETLELNVALGVTGILFNRLNVGGTAVADATRLMPSLADLDRALRIADAAVEKYGISISCGVPVPPCALNRAPYPNVHFGDCPVGTARAYPTVDPLGNVRPCNHSPLILGNLFDADFRSILASDAVRTYAATLPSECKDCEHARTCRGGCRAAAEVCGDSRNIDPFIDLCKTERGQSQCDGHFCCRS